MWASVQRWLLGVVLIAFAAGVLLVSDLSHRKAGSGRMPQVAILQHASQLVLDEGIGGMLDGLKEAGFADGKSVSIRRYNAENDMPTASAIAKEITGGDFALVLTASTLSMQAVANANRDGRTNHVFGLVSDPYGAGVGISRENPLKHPRHLVGYGTMQPVAEAFQLARHLFPGLKTVGTVWNPAESNSEAQLKVARAACRELGIELLEANVDAAAGVMEAASSLVGRDVQALWIPGDVTVLTAVDTIVAVARKGRIPVFTSIPGNAKRGTLFDLGADYHEVGRLAGALAGRILHGTDPASIAVENVMPQTLLVNRAALGDLKEAWQLPDDVLQRATLVGEGSPTAGTTPRPLSKTWNVHVLEYVNVLDVEDGEKGLRTGLHDAGLVEGRDYQLTVRNAQGDMATISGLVDAALTDHADMLITFSTPTLQAALQRARDLPIVFSFVANGIIAGAGRSNEDHLPNVTGVSTASGIEDLLRTVREAVPSAKRVGTLFVPAEVNSVFNKDRLVEIAPQHGMEAIAVAANTSAEVSDAAAALCSQPIDVVVQIGANLTTAAFVSISQAAQRAHIPVFGALSSNAHDGAAVVVTRDSYDGGHEAGLMAARIMRGESPARIPIRPLTTTRIIINLKAARAMGLTIPASLRQRATQVIEQ